ncbi:MAG TPA: tripartite tricarboxylate transporter substrate binding protein [Burkholderiales bacterium]|nr:tripartite tricarboxylate transporter substrate binding protein [Burkholderiales bacterium]
MPSFVLIAAVAAGVLATGSLYGQAYPTRPIRIVTSAAGGSPDLVARLIAQGISGPLGQPVIIDNRSSGIVPAELVAKAPPDGYTLIGTSNVLWLVTLMQKTTFDPLRDFAPIAMTNLAPAVLAVHPSLPVKSVKELIVLAKARPGQLNYSSSTNGTASHLAGELFKALAGVNIVRIAYKGAGLAINDLISGQVQMTFITATSVMPHVKSGRLRALAITSARPSELFPGLPTVAASGLPGYEATSSGALLAPAKTSEAIISRLNHEVVRFLGTPEARERLFHAGSEVVGSSPDELAAAIRTEMDRMRKVIKDAGIRE